jgi:2'-5' RNA ligase
MRLFAALYPPPAVLDAASDLLVELQGSAGSRPTLTWVPPDLLHVTCAFYGEVPPGAVDDLAERLAEVSHDAGPMDLHLRGAGAFGDRVLWLGVGGDTDALHTLSAAAASAGAHAGLRLDRRPRQRAHLTVARARSAARVRTHRGRSTESAASVALDRYAAALSVYVGPTWTARELCLVESDLSSGRPVHQTVAAFTLGE